MTELEIFKDKQKLMRTFIKYDDDDQSDYVLKGRRKAPFESNTLLLQTLLEIACRNVEGDPLRRQALFLKMWNKLTDTKLTDDLKFHMDALFSVRNQAVAEFEKELISMNSREVPSSASPTSCGILSSDLRRMPSVHPEKYRSEFEEVSRIGNGGFGTVWKARHKIDGICYAVKKVMFNYKKDSDFLKVIREVKSFATLNHLNVVRYNQAWLEYGPSCENNSAGDSFFIEKLSSDEESLNVVQTSSSSSFCPSSGSETAEASRLKRNDVCAAPLLRLYIQMEFCDFDLRFWMDERAKGNPLPFRLTASEIFRDILSGVAHIHSKNVIHRDLKPQNIFFSAKTDSIKIGDFGLAALKEELNEKQPALNCGTMPYAAPELRSGRWYDSKVDMYSVGVILIELLTESKTRMELSVVLEQMLSGTISAELCNNWPQYETLVKNLVSSDPTVRFSAGYVLDHLPVSTCAKPTPEADEIERLKETLREKEKRIEELEALLRIYQNAPFESPKF